MLGIDTVKEQSARMCSMIKRLEMSPMKRVTSNSFECSHPQIAKRCVTLDRPQNEERANLCESCPRKRPLFEHSRPQHDSDVQKEGWNGCFVERLCVKDLYSQTSLI
jgi:hypothetical protein